MKSFIRRNINTIRTYFYCLVSGIIFHPSYSIRGRIRVIKPSFFATSKGGEIVIGLHFKANNNLTSNSIGLIQPCIFNISKPGSKIIIGNNVGISGSSINASKEIVIGDNVIIGSGCLISDTDSHPILPEDRLSNNNAAINSIPIVIGNNVFIGARSIILKGVTIGSGSVIGAGSVVSKNIPPNVIFAGNPAQFVKKNQKI
jgi:acetyltransferase-like isoleucine patch superfamily enzyme